MLPKRHKLRLIGAFAALATLALAISCRGFFVNPTLTAINISPSSPEVEVNQNLTLSVYGTYNDGSSGLVNSGVSWSSSTPAVAAFSSSTSNILRGVSLGTTTITANAEAVTATATATVFLGGISAITVSPSSGSVSISKATTASFTASATANGEKVDITTQGAVWTLSPTSTLVTCSPSGDAEVCSAASGANTGVYSLVVSYPGTSLTATAALTVNP